MAVLDLDGKRGLFACYTGLQDEAPLVNPLANLSRIKWHASLPYLGATKITRVVDFNYHLWTQTPTVHLKIAPHGKSFRPIALGTVWLQSKPVPAHGSFIVPFYQMILSLSLFADGTHVCLGLDNVADLSPEVNLSRLTPITSATMNIYICNMGVTAAGAPVLPPSISYFDATPSRMRCGQFDTNDLHFARQDASGPVGFYARSRSIQAELVGGAAGELTITQNVAGYAFALNRDDAVNDATTAHDFAIPASALVRTTAK